MKTLIAIPAMGWVYVDFMQSMLALKKPDAQLIITQNSLVYDARNNMAWQAIQAGIDRILFLDSDMKFDADLLVRLNADMDEKGLDYVSAFFTSRSEPPKPCVYKSVEYGQADGQVQAHAEPYTDHPSGLFETAGSGLGAVLMKVELIKAVAEKFGLPFQPLPYLGEDLSFCWRVAQIGRKMWCDSSLQVGHVGTHVYKEA